MTMKESEYLDKQVERAKPCPFCGSKKIIASDSNVMCDCSIFCDDCGAEGPSRKKELFDEYQNAFEAWNSRV